MDKEKGKKIVTILQIIAGIGLVVCIVLLIKAYTSDKKEDTSELFTKLERHEIKEEQISIKIKDKEIKLDNSGSKTKLNDKEASIKAQYVYTTDKLLILSTIYRFGETLEFYDKDLKKIEFDDLNMVYRDLELVDGKIVATGSVQKYITEDGHRIDGSLDISECEAGATNTISKYKDTLENNKTLVLEKTIAITYDTKLNVTSTSEKTLWDIYGKEIENDTGKYCVIAIIQ